MVRIRSLLTKKKIDRYMQTLPVWKLDKSSKKITVVYTFKNNIDALVFIAKITVHAEVLQHHPDILFTHNRVKITITTHKLNCLTEVDFLLAERIDSSYNGG